MIGALVLGTCALVLGIAAVAQLLPDRERLRGAAGRGDSSRVVIDSLMGWSLLAATVERLGLSPRIARAGLAGRVSVVSLLTAKAGGALAGSLWVLVVAPAAPGRLGWIVAVALPAAGFLGPDAWLERRARRRLRGLRAMLPDALDLLAVGTAAGRSPVAGLAELGGGRGRWHASWRFSPPTPPVASRRPRPWIPCGAGLPCARWPRCAG